MDIGFEILIITMLILVNGIFAMSEMAVITARKSRLQDWVKKGNSRAKAALELAQSPNRFLSSVQIGITSIGILAGVFAGRGVAVWMANYLQALPLVGASKVQPGAPESKLVEYAMAVTTLTIFRVIEPVDPP